MSWASLAGLCGRASLGLVIHTKMNSFGMGDIHGLL